MIVRAILFCVAAVLLVAGLALGVAFVAFAHRIDPRPRERLKNYAFGLLMVAMAVVSLWGLWNERLDWLP
jgi:hypothetical protein